MPCGRGTSACRVCGTRGSTICVGSSDGTGALVEAHAHRFPGVRLLTNDRNRGFGWTYRRGVDAAAHDYIVMVHGDNAWGAPTLRDLFQRVGEADIIVGYTRD